MDIKNILFSFRNKSHRKIDELYENRSTSKKTQLFSKHYVITQLWH